jgi:nitroreductase
MERIAQYEIEPLFLRRWSPRAMNGEPVSEAELMRLFEAARWAPSSGNSQPWRMVYARAGTPPFERLFNLLVDANKSWCVRAGALIVVLSKTTFDSGQPTRTHSYDTGAAWMSLALQASLMGLVAHGMAGFDYDRAKVELGVPDEYAVEAMIALGHPGRVEDLPERVRARESPSGRRSIGESVFEGRFSQAGPL